VPRFEARPWLPQVSLQDTWVMFCVMLAGGVARSSSCDSGSSSSCDSDMSSSSYDSDSDCSDSCDEPSQAQGTAAAPGLCFPILQSRRSSSLSSSLPAPPVIQPVTPWQTWQASLIEGPAPDFFL
jgi:hypothetical protein